MERDAFLIYIIAARADERWRTALESHLARLIKQYSLHLWYTPKILAGGERQRVQEEMLGKASLVLVLTSVDCFNACEEEMAFLATHCPSTMIIPILARAYDLQDTPLRPFQPLPKNEVPLDQAANLDAVLQEVAREIREVVLLQLAPGSELNGQKGQRLKAMLADHTAFLNDRLRSFVGREQELTEVRARIAEKQEQGGYITITGQAGQGKSSLIATLVEHYGRETVVSHFIPFRPGPDYQVSLLRDLMARLILKHDLSDIYVATVSRPALRDYFLNLLRDLSSKRQQEVIFLDGLDQIEEEDLTGERDLSFLPDQLPAGMVFVLGTRPDDTLQPLKLLAPHVEYRLPSLSKGDFERLLARREVHLKATIIEQLHQALQENALYLDLVARELHAVGTLTPQEIIARVASDPANLFYFSMQRLKHHSLDWREVIKPVLGILLATCEPLQSAHIRQILPTIDDERLRDALTRLGGLLTMSGQRAYALFHLKLRDYLREDEAHPHAHIFARDEEEHYHALLAHWCTRGGLAHIWNESKDPREQFRRLYARQHSVTHLYEAQLDQQLFAVLDEGAYGQAKERLDRSARSYMQDLGLGRRAAARPHLGQAEAIALLPFLWRYTLLRSSIRSQADQYPNTLFATMLLLHREAEVLGLAELLTDKSKQVRLFVNIGVHLTVQPGKQAESRQAFLRAQNIADTIEDASDSARALSAIAHGLAQGQQWERAEEIAGRIEDAYSRAEALRAIAQGLAQVQQWQRAEEIAGRIEDAYSRAEALSAIAQGLAQVQQWQRAEKIAGRIESAYSRAEALSAITQELAQTQQEAEAGRVLAQAEEAAGRIEDAAERVETLSAIAWELAQTQQAAEAGRVLAQAEEAAGRIEDAYSRAEALSAIAQVLAQGQQWQRAEEVADKIEHAYSRAEALSAIARGLAQGQQWQRAEEVADKIEHAYSRAEALSAIAEVLAQGQQEAEASRVLTQAEEAAGRIEHASERAEALSAIAQGLAQGQQWQRAEKVADRIEDAYSRAEVLRAIARGLAQGQQWQRAEEVAGRIEHASSRVLALSAIAQGLAQGQQWQRAEEVAGRIEHASDKAEVLRAIAQGLAQGQEWQRAEGVAGRIEHAYSRAEALSAIAQGLAQGQEWQRAEEVAGEIEDAYSRAAALSAIAQGLAQGRQEAEASRVLAQAEEVANRIEHPSERVAALRAIAQGLSQGQQWQRAEEVAGRIEHASSRVAALHAIAEVLAQGQQEAEASRVLAQAEEVASRIEDISERVAALSAIAKGLAQAQQEAEASRVLAMAEEAAGRIEHVYSRVAALSAIAQGLAQGQQWQRAEEVAGKIEHVYSRVAALSVIVQGLAQGQQWQRAEEVAGRIEYASERVAALSVIVQGLAQGQQWQRAEEVAGRIEHASERVAALSVIVQGLAQGQQGAEASRVLAQAEEIAGRIEDASSRAEALSEIAQGLAQMQQWEWLVSLLQRVWLATETRSYALDVFALVAHLLVDYPHLTQDFLASFEWVDAFNKGEV